MMIISGYFGKWHIEEGMDHPKTQFPSFWIAKKNGEGLGIDELELKKVIEKALDKYWEEN